MSEHIVPVKNYVAVFISLLLLTALTTKVAYIDLGQTAIGRTHVIDWNTVAALTMRCLRMPWGKTARSKRLTRRTSCP